MYFLSRYTSKKQSDGTLVVYAILLDVPSPPSVTLGAPSTGSSTKVSLLGFKDPLKWAPAPGKGGITVSVPSLGVSKLPTPWAWVLKLEGLN